VTVYVLRVRTTCPVAALPAARQRLGAITRPKRWPWLGDRRAIEPLAKALAESKAEADFGYSGRFKDEEYNDPCPRWREAIVRRPRTTGRRRAHTAIVAVLNDERSVLEVRHAAAQAFGRIGRSGALAALQDAALRHPFLSVRNVAAMRWSARGVQVDQVAGVESPKPLPAPRSQAPAWERTVLPAPPAGTEAEPRGQGITRQSLVTRPPAPGFWPPADFDALVFIQGDNNIPTRWAPWNRPTAGDRRTS